MVLSDIATRLHDHAAILAAVSRSSPTVAIPEPARPLALAAIAAGGRAPPDRGRRAVERRRRASRTRPRHPDRARPRRAVPGVGDVAVRAGQSGARDDGAPQSGAGVAGDAQPARRHRGAHHRAGAAPGAGQRRRSGRRRRGRRHRPRRHRPGSRRHGLPARRAGGAPRRSRGARLDPRRLSLDCRRAGAHRPVGRRGRSPQRILGRRPAQHPCPERSRHPCMPRADSRRCGARPCRDADRDANPGVASTGSASPTASSSTAWSRGCRGSPTTPMSCSTGSAPMPRSWCSIRGVAGTGQPTSSPRRPTSPSRCRAPGVSAITPSSRRCICPSIASSP